jgi:hypothetical protein
MLDMKRREFILAVGGAAAWPLGVRALQPAMPVIGFLCSGSAEAFAPLVAAFRDGLREVGSAPQKSILFADFERCCSDSEFALLRKNSVSLPLRRVECLSTPSAPPPTRWVRGRRDEGINPRTDISVGHQSRDCSSGENPKWLNRTT